VKKQGIESSSPMAHRHFEAAMDRSIQDANLTRHGFYMETIRLKSILK
jgi:hypothetical protein